MNSNFLSEADVACFKRWENSKNPLFGQFGGGTLKRVENSESAKTPGNARGSMG